MSRLAPSRLAGMAAPMAVWAVHFTLVYSLTGLACADAWPAREWLGVRVLIWGLLLWTAVALATVGWLGWRAHRERQRLADAIGAADATSRVHLERECFAVRVTVLIAGLAGIAIAFTAVPAFVLPDCT